MRLTGEEIGLMRDGNPAAWAELARTAALVRGDVPPGDPAANGERRGRTLAVLIAGGILAMSATLATATPRPAAANGGYDSELFALTNQDRTSNGVPSLRSNGTLQGIGEAAPYPMCGITVAGRAQDMVNRHYFSHYIPSCNQLVFLIMQEAGVHYLSAGENVGWDSCPPTAWACSGDPASYINTEFMNSAEHRNNILDARFTDLGIGSSFPFNDAGLGAGGGWMFAEEFTQMGPPPPPPPPPPIATSAPHPNSPPPPGPSLPPPVATVSATPPPTPPTAPPTPTPLVTPNPLTSTIGPGVPPPLIYQQGGLLSDSVESVLESYLID